MLSVAEASLFYHQFLSLLVGFPAVALCNAFLLRCNASPLLFGKSIACIAVHVGLPWCYKYFAPTGLETLFVVCGKRPRPSPSPDRRGEKHLGDFIAVLKSPLSGEI